MEMKFLKSGQKINSCFAFFLTCLFTLLTLQAKADCSSVLRPQIRVQIERLRTLDELDTKILEIERDIYGSLEILIERAPEYRADIPAVAYPVSDTSDLETKQKEQIEARANHLISVHRYERSILAALRNSHHPEAKGLSEGLEQIMLYNECLLTSLLNRLQTIPKSNPLQSKEPVSLGAILNYDYRLLFRGRVGDSSDVGSTIQLIAPGLIPLTPIRTEWNGIYFDVHVDQYDIQPISVVCPLEEQCLPMRYADTNFDEDFLRKYFVVQKELMDLMREISESSEVKGRTPLRPKYAEPAKLVYFSKEGLRTFFVDLLNREYQVLTLFKNDLEATKTSQQIADDPSFNPYQYESWLDSLGFWENELNHLKRVLELSADLDLLVSEKSQIKWLNFKYDEDSQDFLLNGRVTHLSLLNQDLRVQLNLIESADEAQIEWQGMLFTIRIPHAHEKPFNAKAILCKFGKCTTTLPVEFKSFDVEASVSLEENRDEEN